MAKLKKILGIVFLLLIVSNGFFVWKNIELQKSSAAFKAQVAIQNSDTKILMFAQLFIDKVLRAKQDVSFDDRLKLETMVRDLNDVEILDQWNKFVNSKTEADAQDEVKNLLALLVQKL